MEQRGAAMTTTARALAHPDMPDAAVLARIAERLKRDLGAVKVIVFGSVARGQATVHSDIDLLVIAPSEEKAYLRMARARAPMRGLSTGLPVSPLVLTSILRDGGFSRVRVATQTPFNLVLEARP